MAPDSNYFNLVILTFFYQFTSTSIAINIIKHFKGGLPQSNPPFLLAHTKAVP